MQKLSLETIVARSENPMTAPLDDELVVLEPGRGSYFGLDATGRRIWELIEQPRSAAEICDALRAEFEVDEPTCRTEVLAFLQRLDEADLLVRR